LIPPLDLKPFVKNKKAKGRIKRKPTVSFTVGSPIKNKKAKGGGRRGHKRSEASLNP